MTHLPVPKNQNKIREGERERKRGLCCRMAMVVTSGGGGGVGRHWW